MFAILKLMASPLKSEVCQVRGLTGKGFMFKIGGNLPIKRGESCAPSRRATPLSLQVDPEGTLAIRPPWEGLWPGFLIAQRHFQVQPCLPAQEFAIPGQFSMTGILVQIAPEFVKPLERASLFFAGRRSWLCPGSQSCP
jgi:hypothetical protein